MSVGIDYRQFLVVRQPDGEVGQLSASFAYTRYCYPGDALVTGDLTCRNNR